MARNLFIRRSDLHKSERRAKHRAVFKRFAKTDVFRFRYFARSDKFEKCANAGGNGCVEPCGGGNLFDINYT